MSKSLHDPPSGLASGNLRAIHWDRGRWLQCIAEVVHRRPELNYASMIGCAVVAAAKESA